MAGPLWVKSGHPVPDRLFDACPNVARVCEKERGREISARLNEYDKLW
jgi:hypothetical protein